MRRSGWWVGRLLLPALVLLVAASGVWAAETLCDGLDDDGNSLIDEGCDDDGDDFCDRNLAIIGTPPVCPSGGGDCDDENPGVFPGASEICNGLDDDCSAGVDNGCDDDGDDYCDIGLAVIGTPPACPLGGGDCDDEYPATNPGAPDVCDGVDTDCDGQLDPDGDGDGLSDCVDNCPGTVNPQQENADGDGSGDVCDCAPADPDVWIGAPEINDGRDNQCPGGTGHGLVDEISGLAGFTNKEDPTEFCWVPQQRATLYRWVRAGDAIFTKGCLSGFTDRTCINDAETPRARELLYYLVGAAEPNRGSYGEDSSMVERTVCP